MANGHVLVPEFIAVHSVQRIVRWLIRHSLDHIVSIPLSPLRTHGHDNYYILLYTPINMATLRCLVQVLDAG